jgi:hypothetical protein
VEILELLAVVEELVPPEILAQLDHLDQLEKEEIYIKQFQMIQ